MDDLGSHDSDCDSGLSTDSLDNYKLKSKSQTQSNGKGLTDKENVTVPFYKGEVLVDGIKRKPKHNIKKPDAKLDLSGQYMRFDATTCYRGSSFLGCIQRTNSARTLIDQRFSRRTEISVPNCYSIKTRGRSVSYLEQFKKKIYGVNKVDSTTYSTVGSEQVENLSCTGSVLESSTLSTSEFEFYEDLMANLNGKSSPVEIVEDVPLDKKPTKSRKVPKSSKEKLVVLPKLDSMLVNDKKEIDRKKSLQKRDEYANQVKLRNQFNINRQKEKDRKNKFQKHNPIKSHLDLEECCSFQEKPIQKQKNSDNNVPFSFNEIGNTEKEKIATSSFRKKVLKTNKTDKKLTKCTKNNNSSQDLSVLQQRHEKEKKMVDSLRNLIIKK
uniref:Uncharacterized protein n=1 Tax=Graphocephala atropunctata TaxID=36148 RepID=A0A1B6KY55_9HEMI